MSEYQPPVWITEGRKGSPLCPECQCYPECRMDCPDHRECLRRMPEYLGRFPPGYLDEPPRKSPPDLAAEK